jgi:predicted dehydrogenase
MNNTMGVRIIGTGWVSGEHIKAYVKNPHTEIRGLCNRHPEKARQVRREHGLDCPAGSDYRELLKHEDIDCIVSDREPMISISDAYETHEIAVAAERSADTGKPVALPLS